MSATEQTTDVSFNMAGWILVQDEITRDRATIVVEIESIYLTMDAAVANACIYSEQW